MQALLADPPDEATTRMIPHLSVIVIALILVATIPCLSLDVLPT